MDGIATRVNGSMLPGCQGQLVTLAGRVVDGAGSSELTLEVSVRHKPRKHDVVTLIFIGLAAVDL